ncbi:sodium-independent sulfate anion transporter isoform X1 [Drosophila busckii]|uniref:sodium-independent sulfate anion transporter isoform X1 n=2 Tax=Drosophila busckii TaxID=30019 RepID=UPI00083F3C9C|nr:sodium-independent sulfate anion transporter isoform X1 [Drosophila busckii]
MTNEKNLSFGAGCDEKNKYTYKNGEDFYDQSHAMDMDIHSRYTAPKRANWLLRRIYILSWIRKYDRGQAFADLIAGITLGLTIIPQSIAYASLAGIPSEYGLYSAFMGSMIYVFFGTIPQVSIGPTSLMAIMTLQYCSDKPVQVVVVLAFIAGLVELLMGIFQLGFIVNFIPDPVTKAFTTGTAFIVIIAQAPNLLGVKLKKLPIAEFFSNIHATDAALGITCICLLLLLRLLAQVKLGRNLGLKKLLWYVSISRNALIVFTSGLMIYIWVHKTSLETVPFVLSSKVASAMPTIQLPPFSFVASNRTYEFIDILQELHSGVIVVPIVAVLANVAIAKAFVKDGRLDASQEMLTLGLCNLAGSFVSAMPTCGAFTRSAVSNASGVRTPMAGIYTGLIVLSALSILTPYFQYIPKASLAAVLIAAVVFMIEVKPVLELWRSSKKDFFSWVGTLIICLTLGVELGLLFGILVSLVNVLLRLGNPHVDVALKQLLQCDTEYYIHIKPNTDIFYTGVDTLRSEIRGACALYRFDFPLVVDCARFTQFDATFIEMLLAVANELEEQNVALILHRMSLKQQQLLPVHNNIRYCNEDQLILTLPSAPALTAKQ